MSAFGELGNSEDPSFAHPSGRWHRRLSRRVRETGIHGERHTQSERRANGKLTIPLVRRHCPVGIISARLDEGLAVRAQYVTPTGGGICQWGCLPVRLGRPGSQQWILVVVACCMSERFFRNRRLIMALLLAMLVIVPAIDAAACMAEPETMQSHDADSDPGTEDHAVCAHGHCHHTVPHSLPVSPCMAAVHAVLILSPEKPAPKSFLPDGLMRPPRV